MGFNSAFKELTVTELFLKKSLKPKL